MASPSWSQQVWCTYLESSAISLRLAVDPLDRPFPTWYNDLVQIAAFFERSRFRSTVTEVTLSVRKGVHGR